MHCAYGNDVMQNNWGFTLISNEFLFVFDLKSVVYEEKEKGQTLTSEDLSSVAPAGIELLNLWNDFRKVVKFIDENQWVKPMLERIVEDKNRGMR